MIKCKSKSIIDTVKKNKFFIFPYAINLEAAWKLARKNA
jgi:hypothetical protein